MSVILWLVVVAYVPIVLIWTYVALYYLPRLRQQPIALPRIEAWPADRPAPSVGVVIACYNEEAGIEACVRRLLDQTYPNFELIIVNDRSTDRTGEIVRGLAAEDRRVRLVTIDKLPPGWIGKTHALVRAVEHSQHDFLLFLDSDVQLSPHALNTVLHKAVTDGVDWLSIWPYLDLRSPSEQLLTPPALLVLSYWALPKNLDGDLSSSVQMGNGQFLLARRSAYDALGGHAGVAAELAEDAVLAQRAHAAGQRCWSGLGTDFYITYRDGNFSRTIHALARVLIGTLQTQRRLLLSSQILLSNFNPIALAIVAILGFALSANKIPCAILAGLCVSHWLTTLGVLRQALGMTLARRGPLTWFPLGSLLMAGVCLWCSYLLTGRGTVRWGATRYRVSGSRVVAAVA
jgi:chlorobactene glucosyltransferase